MRAEIKVRTVQLLEEVLGKRRVSRILLSQYIKRMEKAGLLFIHIPKAAGTSIATEIYGSRVGHTKLQALIDWYGRAKFESQPSFSVVRNPYTRVLSAYLFARAGGTKHGAVRNPARYRKNEFKCFKSFVCDWLAHGPLIEKDIIFQPQAFFLQSKEGVSPTFVGRVEELSKVEAFVGEALGRPISFSVINVSSKKKAWQSYYDIETKAAIKKLYSVDFLSFGYDDSLEIAEK